MLRTFIGSGTLVPQKLRFGSLTIQANKWTEVPPPKWNAGA